MSAVIGDGTHPPDNAVSEERPEVPWTFVFQNLGQVGRSCFAERPPITTTVDADLTERVGRGPFSWLQLRWLGGTTIHVLIMVRCGPMSRNQLSRDEALLFALQCMFLNDEPIVKIMSKNQTRVSGAGDVLGLSEAFMEETAERKR